MRRPLRHETVNGVDAEVAERIFDRMRGLIGRKSLARGKGLLIMKCNCIHTFFMRFPIDATFLDRKGNVVRTVRGIRPWRPWIWGGWRAARVLETAAETVRPDACSGRAATFGVRAAEENMV